MLMLHDLHIISLKKSYNWRKPDYNETVSRSALNHDWTIEWYESKTACHSSLHLRDNLADGTRKLKSNSKSAFFPLGGCSLFLFLRLVDTFLRHVSILDQITPTGLAGLGATLIIKVAMHISVLIYCVLTLKFRMLEILSCLSCSSS